MKYLTQLYSGRINQKEFICGCFFFVCLIILGKIVFTAIPEGISPLVGSFVSQSDITTWVQLVHFAIVAVFYVFIFSILVRRLHDIGRTGWWSIPPTTILVALVLLFIRSDGENKYGPIPSPKRKLFHTILGLTVYPKGMPGRSALGV